MSGLVGIDWGTSHRRAYLLDEAGSLLEERADDQGLLAAQGRFAASFNGLVQGWPADWPVLMSGMVGAAAGWQEVPYLDADTPLARLPRHVARLRDAPAGRRVVIVPGMRRRVPQGEVDVMRGEETQLLGAQALGQGDGWYVLPGTHSKWVRVEGGMVEGWRTHMTGELFALLGQHGTLAGLVGDEDDPAAFTEGLRAAAGGTLTHTLFGVRARVVTGTMPAAQARSYLSGLLIGTEWRDMTAWPRRLTLIASAALAGPYVAAARHHGCDVRALAPRDVYVAALGCFQKGLTW